MPVGNLVGEEGGGWHYAKLLLANERVSVAEVGRSTRQLRRLDTLAAGMLRDGKPLSDYPPFARRMAELKLRHFVLQSTCYQAVAEAMAGTPPGAEASLMKIRGSELQQDIAEAMTDALGLAAIAYDPADLNGAGRAPVEGPFGAPGILKDHLHGRAATIYGGSNEIQRNIIAKMALGL